MKKFSAISLLLIGIAMFQSCITKEIDYENYFEENKIVVTGFITPNQADVLLTKMVSPFDIEDSDDLQNPKAFIYEGDRLFAELKSDNNRIFHLPAAKSFNPHAEYTLKVSSDKLGEAMSKPVHFPRKPELIFDSVSKTKPNELKVYYHINDDPEMENHYYVFSYLNGESDFQDEYFNPYNMFDDSQDLHLTQTFYIPQDTSTLDTDSVKIVVCNLSDEISKHLQSITDNEDYQEIPLIDGINPVFMNIIDGVGIFGTYNTDTITYVIPK